MIDNLLNTLAVLMKEYVWISPLLALAAGVITSVTPCALSNVPLVIGYVGGTRQKDTKKALKLSITFAVGTAVTFTTLGVIASSVGKLIGTSSSWWYIILGVLMVLMALQTWEIINIIPSVNLLSKNKKRGYVGAMLAGILGGLFSSPCATPVLIVLLGILAKGSNLFLGIVLMLCYSLGHSALIIVAGTSVGFVQKINASEKYSRLSTILKMVMGIIILGIALYMFYLGF
ncbi:MAG: cytochrome c biogenesis CcdA family protein [Agathobacter sp.]